MPKVKTRYYSVRNGEKSGIYKSWDEYYQHIKDYPKARYKKFNTLKEAQEFKEGINKETKKKKQTTLKFSNDELLIDNDRIVVYTDGTCEDNGDDNAKGGIGVFFGDNDPRNLSEELPSELQTNNRAEIYAVIRAIKNCKDDSKILEIKTDSTYVINACERWIKKWVDNDWYRDDKKTKLVKNKDILFKLYNLIETRKKIIFTHVKSHSGIHGNKEADTLAKSSIKK
ncbi:2031_t:CDS:1 [Scutellospora calospora]|uniref:2031_t:CDS:1 n=1 Tax=Scutellospora calospora TaxID=85575 RepID=A0ACA9MXQ1_9GLOM|nr:2031_t:CDS:1 [Scutellospora calospora]